jgi:hypothetical protein
MTVRSDRKATMPPGRTDFTVAIEISDWPVADAHHPRREWQPFISRCDPATADRDPANGMTGVYLRV